MALKPPKCSICKGSTKLTVGPQLILDKYIVEDVKSYKCQNCGMGYTELGEYERIRLKIAAIEKKAKKPVPAGSKYFVL